MILSRTKGIVILTIGAAAVVGGILLSRFLGRKPVALTGAVLVRSNDVNKQVPIRDVRITLEGGTAAAGAISSPIGYFKLTLKKEVRAGEPVILQFREPQYLPLDVTVLAGDRLNNVYLAPLADFSPTIVTVPEVPVSNVTIRYTVKSTTMVNVGSEVKTFRVANTGNVPCNSHYPCSPDGKWKASVDSATLDAPRGNVFSNARVSCIAGPCPFTRIRSDHFSAGGPNLSVSILDWSDTAIFLFEAELFRSMISDSVRRSYPVVFGTTMHFTVPANSEGICIEADVNRDSIIFPLGPQPILSWAACSVSVTLNRNKAYQCELKPGYAFK
jgi:hypothetical protein